MAKKDTMKALNNRDVSEEVATVLLRKYNSMSEIAEATVADLTALGLSDEEAASTLSKLIRRAPRASASRAKKAAEAVEEAPAPPMEEVFDSHVPSEREEKLMAIAQRKGVFLPAKIIFEIATRTSNADLSDESCEKLVDVASRMYASHTMDKNESAGVMAAHSLGEPGTQMNMRTFHYAGVANVNVTQGLPRLIEIVDARRTPSTPSMHIPLLGIAERDENVARHVAYEIEMTMLQDLSDIEVDLTNMRLVIRPDARKMSLHGLTPEDIVDRLNKIRSVRGMSRVDGFDVVVTSNESSFKKLHTMHDAVRGAKMKGIDGIKRAVLSKDKDGTYSIVTEGSNLKDVLKVEGVDAESVMTNSILEVADVLGIEAARNSMIREAMGTLGEAGLDVDIRHIMLVADLMTNDGCVKAIGRHGVSGKKSSVLARAAFEITTAHLLSAAMVGEVDNLEGVTENIIVGQPVTLGTGAVNLIYDPRREEER